jgi:hypothetical protein
LRTLCNRYEIAENCKIIDQANHLIINLGHTNWHRRVQVYYMRTSQQSCFHYSSVGREGVSITSLLDCDGPVFFMSYTHAMRRGPQPCLNSSYIPFVLPPQVVFMAQWVPHVRCHIIFVFLFPLSLSWYSCDTCSITAHQVRVHLGMAIWVRVPDTRRVPNLTDMGTWMIFYP